MLVQWVRSELRRLLLLAENVERTYLLCALLATVLQHCRLQVAHAVPPKPCCQTHWDACDWWTPVNIICFLIHAKRYMPSTYIETIQTVVLCYLELFEQNSLSNMIYADVGRLSCCKNTFPVCRILYCGEITWKQFKINIIYSIYIYTQLTWIAHLSWQLRRQSLGVRLQGLHALRLWSLVLQT